MRLDEVDMLLAEFIERGDKCDRIAFVGGKDGRLPAAQDVDARAAAAAQANDENALVRSERDRRIRVFHRRAFTQAKPPRLKSAEAVQNRCVTFVSGQPPSSK